MCSRVQLSTIARRVISCGTGAGATLLSMAPVAAVAVAPSWTAAPARCMSHKPKHEEGHKGSDDRHQQVCDSVCVPVCFRSCWLLLVLQ
jgi:hypothetical protein